jgi:hypothetical protein
VVIDEKLSEFSDEFLPKIVNVPYVGVAVIALLYGDDPVITCNLLSLSLFSLDDPDCATL